MSVAEINPKFSLGKVFVSTRAKERLQRDLEVEPALGLHLRGYWGQQEDDRRWAANDHALQSQGRVQSIFGTSQHETFVILTDLANEKTFIFLLDEEDAFNRGLLF